MASGGAGVDALPQENATRTEKFAQRLDLVSARVYLPPGSHMAHEPRFSRIGGYSTANGKHNHRCQLSYGVDVAVRVVLVWLWKQYLEAHPQEKCPYEFPYTIE